jgi:transcriptional regulator with GAF, ATPase, and Fis domain
MPTLSEAATEVHDLVALVGDPSARAAVIERSLDALREVVAYDLAAVFVLEARRLRMIAAAGPLDGPAVRAHGLDLDAFPTIRESLRIRRPIALDATHHASDEGDPYDGVLDLPEGHSCMVVPLYAGDEDIGIITLDRSVCGAYPRTTVTLAGIYGQLIALAIKLGRQNDELERYRFRLRERNRVLVRETGGDDVAVARMEASRSPAMRRVVELAQKASSSHVPLLLLGETGTGKEVLAAAVHAWSPRADGPFVRVNCAAIPENLVESELFGHVRGAFTGATQDRRGHFQVADGGTLLLDEVGELPLAAQAKLLRALQEGSFHPVGADRPVQVDVRVLAATHRDLRRAVEEGRFREDLYYRLAVFPLHLPALRERVEDVGPLSSTILNELARRTGRGPWSLHPAALEALRGSAWRGNVRELGNVLERATILLSRGEITPDLLLLDGAVAPVARGQAPGAVTDFTTNERHYFEALLEATVGRITGPGGAAERAGLAPSTLRSKLEKHGLLR